MINIFLLLPNISLTEMLKIIRRNYFLAEAFLHMIALSILFSLMFPLLFLTSQQHHCMYVLTFVGANYATGDMLTKTTGLIQPQNKQVTVEVMQLLHIKNVVDGEWVEG